MSNSAILAWVEEHIDIALTDWQREYLKAYDNIPAGMLSAAKQHLATTGKSRRDK